MNRIALSGLPSRRSRGAATVQKVLEAAFALVSRDGINAVTMLEISREAGVSEKTVYNIFGSKTNLVAKLVELYQTNLAVDFGLRDRPDVEEIFASIRAVAADLERNVNWSEAIAGLYFSNDIHDQAYARLQAIGLRHFDAAIRLGTGGGCRVDPDDLAIARHQFANLGYALVHDLAIGRLDGDALGLQLCFGLSCALQSLFGTAWRDLLCRRD